MNDLPASVMTMTRTHTKSRDGRVSILTCGVVLGADHQAPALARPAVHGLDDVDHLLLVRDEEVDLLVL